MDKLESEKRTGTRDGIESQKVVDCKFDISVKIVQCRDAADPMFVCIYLTVVVYKPSRLICTLLIAVCT